MAKYASTVQTQKVSVPIRKKRLKKLSKPFKMKKKYKMAEFKINKNSDPFPDGFRPGKGPY